MGGVQAPWTPLQQLLSTQRQRADVGSEEARDAVGAPKGAPSQGFAAEVKAKRTLSAAPHPHFFSFLQERENLPSRAGHSSFPPKSLSQILKTSRAPSNFGERECQLPLSCRPYRDTPFPSVATKLQVGSRSAPTWKRAPPTVRGSPSAPACPELNFGLIAGSSCGSNRSPALEGTRAHAHTHALTLPLTLPRPRSRHPTLRAAPPRGGGVG